MSNASLKQIDKTLIGESSSWGKPKLAEETCFACGATKFQNRYHDKGCRWCVGNWGNAVPPFLYSESNESLKRRLDTALREARERLK